MLENAWLRIPNWLITLNANLDFLLLGSFSGAVKEVKSVKFHHFSDLGAIFDPNYQALQPFTVNIQ